MLKFLASLGFLAFLCSCGIGTSSDQRKSETPFTENQIDSLLSKVELSFSQPVFQDSSDYMLLPIGTELLKKKISYDREGYFSGSYPRNWNLLFYHRNTKESRLLTENKMRISSFSVNIADAGPMLSHGILYEITDTDYNKDQQLDNKDPEYLFFSQADGTGLRRLSPAEEHLHSFSIIPHTDQLILRTRRDENKDLKFDSQDQEIWYQIDLASSAGPVEMIDSASQKTIQRLFFEQWLQPSSQTP